MTVGVDGPEDPGVVVSTPHSPGSCPRWRRPRWMYRGELVPHRVLGGHPVAVDAVGSPGSQPWPCRVVATSATSPWAIRTSRRRRPTVPSPLPRPRVDQRESAAYRPGQRQDRPECDDDRGQSRRTPTRTWRLRRARGWPVDASSTPLFPSRPGPSLHATLRPRRGGRPRRVSCLTTARQVPEVGHTIRRELPRVREPDLGTSADLWVWLPVFRPNHGGDRHTRPLWPLSAR